MMKFGSFIAPMLLSEQPTPFDDDEYLFELKFDGIRATLHASPQGVKIYTRRGNEVSKTFPELQNIKNIVKKKVIFDGEIVSFDKSMPSFSKLQRRNLLKDRAKIITMSTEEPVAFVSFDCLYEGKDLTKIPLEKRKDILEKYPDTEEFIKAKYSIGKGKKLFEKVVKTRMEGIVAKKKNSLYVMGTRTKEWIKIKNFRQEKFIIGGYSENKMKTSLLLGEWRGKKFHYVGKVSMMRDTVLYKKICSARTIKNSPFFDYEGVDCHYLPLKFSCSVVYIERTPNGHLRQPVFKKEV